jgi:hypothetical protein
MARLPAQCNRKRRRERSDCRSGRTDTQRVGQRQAQAERRNEAVLER